MPVSHCWTHSETDLGQDLNQHLKSTGSIFGEPRDVWALRIGVSSNPIFNDLQKVLFFPLTEISLPLLFSASLNSILSLKTQLKERPPGWPHVTPPQAGTKCFFFCTFLIKWLWSPLIDSLAWLCIMISHFHISL